MITAAVHYRSACEMNLEACGSMAMDEYSCRKAMELGAPRDELAAKAGPVNRHPEFGRSSGQRDIQPPRSEARGICNAGLDHVTAEMILCVSDAGVPSKIVFTELSGAPRWDQKLFETVRTWRYTPFIGKTGRPEAVCTGVSFHYRPSCR